MEKLGSEIDESEEVEEPLVDETKDQVKEEEKEEQNMEERGCTANVVLYIPED